MKIGFLQNILSTYNIKINPCKWTLAIWIHSFGILKYLKKTIYIYFKFYFDQGSPKVILLNSLHSEYNILDWTHVRRRMCTNAGSIGSTAITQGNSAWKLNKGTANTKQLVLALSYAELYWRRYLWLCGQFNVIRRARETLVMYKITKYVQNLLQTFHILIETWVTLND